MTVCTRTVFLTGDSAADAAALSEAARAAVEGGIVVFPTETVYGLGSSAFSEAAKNRIYGIKGRDAGKALPILAESLEDARRWAVFSPPALSLARRFWPGPLSLVLCPTPEGRPLLSPGATTLAVRVPNHPAVLTLLRLSKVPWASSSANRSGEPAIAGGDEAAAAFAGAADWIVVGERGGGLPSTVVDASGEAPRILREGALRESEIFS